MRSLASIESATVEAISAVVTTFQAAPFDFLFEADLQHFLFMELRTRMPDTFEVPRHDATEPPYKLRLVYSEYGRKIDLVCLDPVRAQASARRQHKGWDTYIYNLPVHIGIELKYRKMGDRFDFSACLNDLSKLRDLHTKGLVTHTMGLAFLQDSAYIEPFCGPKSGWQGYPVADVSDLDGIYVFTPAERLRCGTQGDAPPLR